MEHCSTNSANLCSMTCKLILVLLAIGVTAVVAKPHVITLDLEDLDVLEEVLPLLRQARSMNLPVDEVIVAEGSAPQVKHYAKGASTPIRWEGQYSPFDSVGAASSAHGHHDPHSDHVDYGAYTGKGGAFGWYTDHPVLIGPHHKGGYHRR